MRSELTEEFENTAAWREEKAAVHRADPRNRGAVEILRHLAATADDVPLALSEYAVFSDPLPPSGSPPPPNHTNPPPTPPPP